ncbi:MAG: trypsin-like peptidase domain-containing protein [Deltaproteobacteria bacterium]
MTPESLRLVPATCRPIVILAALSCGATWINERPARAQEPNGLAVAAAIQEAFVKAIESAERSVVSVSRDKRSAAGHPETRHPLAVRGMMTEPAPGDPNWIPNEFGAGIIIDKNGLILTNYHLVRGGPAEGKLDQKAEQTIYVRLHDRRGFEAHIFAADPRSDLAVLKIPAADLTPLELGAAAPVRKGQMVIALGNPYAIARDGSPSATWGIVSNIGRQAMLEGERQDPEYQRKLTVHHLGTLLQIDTRLELGTSGGALLNLKGELIGMTTSLAAIVGYEKSAGFAVPFDDSMQRVIKSLKQGKEVEYGFLGITPGEITPSQSALPEWAPVFERIRQHGAARIDQVVPNLPAHRSGLADGDLVLKIGDKAIFNTNDLMREIGLLAPGTVVKIKVFRPMLPHDVGREIDFAVEVGKWPVIDEEGIIATNPLRGDWQGIVYDYSTARKRFLPMVPQRMPPGVRVMEVKSGSEAAGRGILPGELITHVRGNPVRSPREFADAVRGATGQVTLKISTPSDRSASDRDVVIKPR